MNDRRRIERQAVALLAVLHGVDQEPGRRRLGAAAITLEGVLDVVERSRHLVEQLAVTAAGMRQSQLAHRLRHDPFAMLPDELEQAVHVPSAIV